MKHEKVISSSLIALMISTILVGSVLAADLGEFPSNLATKTDNLSTLDAVVVVGRNAATADVVGAVDLAMALATVSYQTKTITTTGVSAVTGIERKIAIPTSSSGSQIGGTTSNNLPSTLQTYHFSGLKEGQYEYRSVKHSYKEIVELGTTSLIMTNRISDPVNGTLKMRLDSGALKYKYRFVDAISASDFSYTSANTTSYQNPIKVTIAGKEFNIVAIPSTTSFVALTGSVGWVTAGSTTGLTVGDLTALVDAVYTGTQASVRIVDANGNLVKNLGVVGTTTTSFTYGGDTYNIKVLNTATSTKESIADSAQLAFAKGDVEKTYDGSDTSTLSDWGSDWIIAGEFTTPGQVTAGSNITVTYQPATLEDKDKYYEAGAVFKGPGDYFEISYAGLYPSNFAKVTIDTVTGKTVYNSTTATGYKTWSGLNGIRIKTDVSGSIVSGSNNYDEVYVLFNGTSQTGTLYGTYAWVGYWDKTTSRIVVIDPVTYPANADSLSPLFSFTLSYGGGATASYVINASWSNSTLFSNFKIYDSDSAEVTMAFQNKSAASTSAPEIMLGATVSKAEDPDVSALIEGATTNIGTQLKDVITQGGVQVYSVKSNADADDVVVGIPPETVYALVQFGKIGAAAAPGVTTYNEAVGVTTSVAKLDSEVTASDKAKNLVLVGGPCANTLVQDLVTAGKLDASYTCAGGTPGSAWEANTGYIILVPNAFTTGKIAIVAAGTMAEQTRMATSILQNYKTYTTQLTGKTTVKFTGTSIANVQFA
jgi:hypothetical protein